MVANEADGDICASWSLWMMTLDDEPVVSVLQGEAVRDFEGDLEGDLEGGLRGDFPEEPDLPDGVVRGSLGMGASWSEPTIARLGVDGGPRIA